MEHYRILQDRLPSAPNQSEPDDILALTAEERQRSFYRCHSENGHPFRLNLKRGTILQDGDRLISADDDRSQQIIIAIAAKPEPVLTVTADHPLDLLRAAYHLGNRHVPLEVTATCLKLSPDPVLKDMLERMSLTVTEAIAPFHPEPGAYHHHGA